MTSPLRQFRLLCLALAALSPQLRAEPANAVTLSLEGTPQFPRNSEGSFATLRSGRIAFYYSQFAGGTSDFSPCRLVEIDSDDQGRTWSAPKPRFEPEQGMMEMSASLLRLASGKLALFSIIKHSNVECRPFLRLSTDDGQTWSAPQPIVSAPGYFVLNDDRVIQTRSGRLIAPVAYHRVLGSAQDWEKACDLRAITLWYYSDDEGATWTESPTWWTIPVASRTGLQEPGTVELADGSLFSWARSDAGFQYAFRSRDNGQTWSAPQPTTLFSPTSPASIKRLPASAELLAVYNDHSGQFPFVHSPQTYSGRTPLAAALSSDGGQSWRTLKLLESDPDRDYCYIAIHYAGDAVLLSYMANSRLPGVPSRMIIRRIALPWLCAPEDALAAKARAALHPILEHEESWQKIHAAEALMAGGEAGAIRTRFLALVPTVDSRVYRVGVWRVLANTAPTAAERAACVARVEQIFLDPAATDHSQAIETLCKLRVPVSGPALAAVRVLARPGPQRLRPLALWALVLAKEPGALTALCALLQSPDPTMRLDAAYALRLLKENDPAALQALAAAADLEQPATPAYPYLLSAAYALNAAPRQREAWRRDLQAILAQGTTDARFESCQGLLAGATAEDLPQYAPLLDDPGVDTRVGAALSILYVDARY